MTTTLSDALQSRWLALAKIVGVLVSAVGWILIPEFGIWFTILAVFPWGLQLFSGLPVYRRTPFDWAILVFLLTAVIGYWAAYDQPSAWQKLGLIVSSILLYYAIVSQPLQNFKVLSFFALVAAIGLALYYFLTDNFTDSTYPGSIWWISHRPGVSWPLIHPGYLSGLLVLLMILGSYFLWTLSASGFKSINLLYRLVFVVGFVLITAAFFLTISRGAWVIGLALVGTWFIGNAFRRQKILSSMRSFYPALILVFISVMIAMIYLGPARFGSSDPSVYGQNTRAELLGRGAYFLLDYPIIGGGLNSFPGLYSRYMISIPAYYFINSYNVFLDVAIEQGLIGGIVFAWIYLSSIWLVSGAMISAMSDQARVISWIALCVLIITVLHGLFYDYIYNGVGTLLMFFPVGLATFALMIEKQDVSETPVLGPTHSWGMRPLWLSLVLVLGLTLIFLSRFGDLRAVWFANLGAVEMSRVELQDFPTNVWAESDLVPALSEAQSLLQHSVQYSSINPTATYRLGLISMLDQNFDTAVRYMELAHQALPTHRGIVKSLAYCYVWQGELDKAQPLFHQIPEAQAELEVYTWWWGTQGRADLSDKASQMSARLAKTMVQ